MAYDTHYRTAPLRRRRGVTWEYRGYFLVILFLIALPIAVLQWTAEVFHPRAASPHPGVMHKALNEARSITTTIFSA